MKIIFMMVLLAPMSVFADTFAYSLDRAIEKITPLMHQDGIYADDREKALSIANGLLKGYPDNSGAHYVVALVNMAINQGDTAIKHAQIACESDPAHCAAARKWVKQITESFSSCIDDLRNTLDCEMTNFSGDTLTKTVAGMYFTNRGKEQVVIGKLTKMKGEMMTLKVTWTANGSEYKKGETRDFSITQLTKLREGHINDAARKQGWQ